MRPSFQLKSVQFRREREESWSDLEKILAVIEEKGLRALAPEDLMRLPELYRAAVSSLSVARAVSLDRNLLDYLEGLCRRAYVTVYATRRRITDTFFVFFLDRFPRLVWSLRLPVLLSLVILAVGILTGRALTLDEPDRYYSFVSDAMSGGRDPLATRGELAEVLTAKPDRREVLSLFAAFLFTNNAQIGLLCFSLGILAGVPVIFLLFINGLVLGAMAAIHEPHGLTVDFWAWVLPHGVTELLAVIICAAAGLSIGRAMIFPGAHDRRQAVVRASREAAAVVTGAAAMFLVAAVIEGVLRQLIDSIPIRIGMTVASLILWVLYFEARGRRNL